MLGAFVFGTADPPALADFYQALLGWEEVEREPQWVPAYGTRNGSAQVSASSWRPTTRLRCGHSFPARSRCRRTWTSRWTTWTGRPSGPALWERRWRSTSLKRAYAFCVTRMVTRSAFSFQAPDRPATDGAWTHPAHFGSAHSRTAGFVGEKGERLSTGAKRSSWLGGVQMLPSSETTHAGCRLWGHDLAFAGRPGGVSVVPRS